MGSLLSASRFWSRVRSNWGAGQARPYPFAPTRTPRSRGPPELCRDRLPARPLSPTRLSEVQNGACTSDASEEAREAHLSRFHGHQQAIKTHPSRLYARPQAKETRLFRSFARPQAKETRLFRSFARPQAK